MQMKEAEGEDKDKKSGQQAKMESDRQAGRSFSPSMVVTVSCGNSI